MMKLDAVAISGLLGMYLIAMFVLHTGFLTNIDILLYLLTPEFCLAQTFWSPGPKENFSPKSFTYSKILFGPKLLISWAKGEILPLNTFSNQSPQDLENLDGFCQAFPWECLAAEIVIL